LGRPEPAVSLFDLLQGRGCLSVSGTFLYDNARAGAVLCGPAELLR
jgi:hypothetical protein